MHVKFIDFCKTSGRENGLHQRTALGFALKLLVDSEEAVIFCPLRNAFEVRSDASTHFGIGSETPSEVF